MPVWLEASAWGLFSGGMLVVGAAIAWFVRVPARAVATVMAFGAGVLVSALAFDLMDEAEATGGLRAAGAGFLLGAVVYTAANVALARYGARHRKRSSGRQPSEEERAGSGAAIAVGALIDGIPESVVLGLSLLGGSGVALPVLAAIAISNLPEGLSSSAGMKAAGRSAHYVFGVWGGIAVASAVAAGLGVVTLDGASPQALAVLVAVAAGAIMAMVADTMIPEAFEAAHALTGLVAALGFLTAFSLQRLG